MIGLYIFTENSSPQIHSFNSVAEAKKYTLNVCKKEDIEIDTDDCIDYGKDGFYITGNCGNATFECQRVIKH